MAAGDERDALAELADRLCAEFGYTTSHDPADESRPSPARTQLFAGSLSTEDEQLVATVRQSLVRIAAALGVRMPPGVPETAVSTLIDGAEMVMRSELAMGTPPATMMPSFVFLVTLPLVDQDEAIELSDRTACLLKEAIG